MEGRGDRPGGGQLVARMVCLVTCTPSKDSGSYPYTSHMNRWLKEEVPCSPWRIQMKIIQHLSKTGQGLQPLKCCSQESEAPLPLEVNYYNRGDGQSVGNLN